MFAATAPRSTRCTAPSTSWALRSTPAEGDATRWRWDVAAYYAQVRDEILSVDDPAAPGNSLTTNIDRTTHAGLEALLGASFAVAAASDIGSSRSSA